MLITVETPSQPVKRVHCWPLAISSLKKDAKAYKTTIKIIHNTVVLFQNVCHVMAFGEEQAEI